MAWFLSYLSICPNNLLQFSQAWFSLTYVKSILKMFELYQVLLHIELQYLKQTSFTNYTTSRTLTYHANNIK